MSKIFPPECSTAAVVKRSAVVSPPDSKPGRSAVSNSIVTSLKSSKELLHAGDHAVSVIKMKRHFSWTERIAKKGQGSSLMRRK